MKKILSFLFGSLMVSGIFYTSCNTGTINTMPRLSKLIVKSSSTAVTGADANMMFADLSSYEAHDFFVQNYPFGSNSELNFSTRAIDAAKQTLIMSFFKNCTGATLDTCTEATPATNDWEQCFKEGYELNGSSALEQSCFVDNLFFYSKDQTTSCKYSSGKEIDINRYFPWDITTWSIPSKASFQGVSSSGKITAGETFKYFRTKPEGSDDEQYILALEQGKGIVLGYKNSTRNEFLFVWANFVSLPNDYGVTVIIGNPATNSFEAYNSIPTRTIRIKSNGTYVYYQEWASMAPTSADNPATSICAKLSDMTDATGSCITAFGLSAENAANDDKFTLKLVDASGLNTADRYDMNDSTYRVDEKLQGCFD